MRKTFLLMSLVALPFGKALADEPVTLVGHEKDGLYELAGTFYVAADRSVVWDVLTSFEQIPKFVSELKKSHIQKDLGPYHFLLEQEFEGGILFITQRVRVVLDVSEIWDKTIRFSDIEHKDFSIYQGSWNLKRHLNDGYEVIYELKVAPNFSTPFTGDFIHGGAKDLLEAVRKEMIRRQAEK